MRALASLEGGLAWESDRVKRVSGEHVDTAGGIGEVGVEEGIGVGVGVGGEETSEAVDEGLGCVGGQAEGWGRLAGEVLCWG